MTSKYTDLSTEDADAPGLRFKSQDDAFDFARKCVEESRSFLASSGVGGFSERYERGELELVLSLRSKRSPSKYRLTFRAIPFGRSEPLCDAVSVDFPLKSSDVDSNGGHNFVLGPVAHAVHGPEHVIPSMVWLEAQHQVEDCCGDVAGSTKTASPTVCDDSLGTKREMGVGTAFTGRTCNAVSGVIKAAAKIDNHIKCDEGDANWHRLNEFDLVDVLPAINAELSKWLAWATINVGSDSLLEICDVSLGVIDAIKDMRK